MSFKYNIILNIYKYKYYEDTHDIISYIKYKGRRQFSRRILRITWAFVTTEVITKMPRCYAIPFCERFDVELIKCDSCVRVFFGHACRTSSSASYNQSLASKFIKICNGCERLVNSKSRHDCDVVYYKTCRSL